MTPAAVSSPPTKTPEPQPLTLIGRLRNLMQEWNLFRASRELVGDTATADAVTTCNERLSEVLTEYFADMAQRPPSPIRLCFVKRMETELLNNRLKGEWNAWRPNAEQIVAELIHHINKLDAALQHPITPAFVSEYAADVANLAMKADQMFGVQECPLISVRDMQQHPANPRLSDAHQS